MQEAQRRHITQVPKRVVRIKSDPSAFMFIGFWVKWAEHHTDHIGIARGVAENGRVEVEHVSFLWRSHREEPVMVHPEAIKFPHFEEVQETTKKHTIIPLIGMGAIFYDLGRASAQ